LWVGAYSEDDLLTNRQIAWQLHHLNVISFLCAEGVYCSEGLAQALFAIKTKIKQKLNELIN